MEPMINNGDNRKLKRIISEPTPVDHYKTYITPKHTNFVGEVSFNNINVNKANSIKIKITGNWSVHTTIGNYTVTNPTIIGSFIPLFYQKTIKIK